MKNSILFALFLLPLFTFGQTEILFTTPTPAQTYKVEYWKVERYIRDGYPEFWEQNWYSETVSGENLLFSFSKDRQDVTVYDGVKFVARISNRFNGYYYGMEDPRKLFKNKLHPIKITRQ